MHYPIHINGRSQTQRVSLFREYSGRNNDMNTTEYVEFRDHTVKVENGLTCKERMKITIA